MILYFEKPSAAWRRNKVYFILLILFNFIYQIIWRRYLQGLFDTIVFVIVS